MSNSRLQVGLDIDGVLLWYDVGLFLDYCQQCLGWTVDREAYRATHCWQAATGGKTTAEIAPAFTQFLLGRPDLQKPVPGAYEAMKQLTPFCSWHGITARPADLSSATRHVLARHYPGTHFTSFSWRRSLDKADIIQRRGIKVCVEDSTREIESILDSGIKVAIVQFPNFAGLSQRAFRDHRVVRLAACDRVAEVSCLNDQKLLWRDAWRQTRREVKQRLPVLLPTAP